MQHDVFANPAPRSRASYPFLVVLQADLSAEKSGRIVAPMTPLAAMTGWLADSCRLSNTQARNIILLLN